MSKKQDQLELLNLKFDKLIEVLLTQQTQKVANPDRRQEEPSDLRLSRPSDYDVILKHETPPVPLKKVISFFVDPDAMITINGIPYEGNVSVEEGLATVIRRMLCDWERYKSNILRDVTHPTRQHVVSGKL
jgi:hypothetical protein